MKTGILLIICLISIINSNLYGQNFVGILIVKEIPEEIAVNEKMDLTSRTVSQQRVISADILKVHADSLTYYRQKNKAQKLNSLLLIPGRPIVDFPGIGSGLDISYDPGFTTRPFHINRNENSNCSGLAFALTRLVMMAGSISCFINSLTDKNMTALKLSCQKTSFGASNKACKKVTGLTFGICLGK